MRVRVLPGGTDIPTTRRDTLFLVRDGWDDWFKFETLHFAHYVDRSRRAHSLGGTKVGRVGLTSDERRPELPELSTDGLEDQFFSLAQDSSFYERLSAIDDDVRERVLAALRDIAYDLDLLAEVEKQQVTRISLLRDVPLSTVRGQFARLARGGARLTDYSFSYTVPRTRQSRGGATLEFTVVPESRPPTNIHVLIGRNAVGKSTLLNSMAKDAVNGSEYDSDDVPANGGFQAQPGGGPLEFSNLVSVSFSAFDAFPPLTVPQDRTLGLTYHYIGLKKKSRRPDSDATVTKSSAALARELTVSAENCLVGARRQRLQRAVSLLESDPIFAEMGLSDLIAAEGSREDIGEEMRPLFSRLSSGHRIVLLTIARLVETVEEKSLVLLDEPEAHLHPPLLSAFIRALSDLLTNRNGVAIVATHSPVVLQEVPSSCVYKLNRTGRRLTVSRPEIETFAENVGVLTDEIFGLEVTATGFHRMLTDAAREHFDYGDALAEFDGELGAEGRAILRARIAARNGYVES